MVGRFRQVRRNTHAVKDKTSIVTGGGSGIGLETARRLHAEGARVLLNGRDEAKLRAAAAGFGQSDRVAVFSGDIAKPATSLAWSRRRKGNLAA